MSTEVLEHQHASHQKNLVVRVRYLASRKQYVDPDTRPEETLAALKPRVLDFFSLIEGQIEGGTKTYLFSLGGIVQINLNATVGLLVDGKHELKLDLIERFEQG